MDIWKEKSPFLWRVRGDIVLEKDGMEAGEKDCKESHPRWQNLLPISQHNCHQMGVRGGGRWGVRGGVAAGRKQWGKGAERQDREKKRLSACHAYYPRGSQVFEGGCPQISLHPRERACYSTIREELSGDFAVSRSLLRGCKYFSAGIRCQRFPTLLHFLIIWGTLKKY